MVVGTETVQAGALTMRPVSAIRAVLTYGASYALEAIAWTKDPDRPARRAEMVSLLTRMAQHNLVFTEPGRKSRGQGEDASKEVMPARSCNERLWVTGDRLIKRRAGRPLLDHVRAFPATGAAHADAAWFAAVDSTYLLDVDWAIAGTSLAPGGAAPRPAAAPNRTQRRTRTR